MRRNFIKKIILLSSIFLPFLFYTHLYAGEANLTWDQPTTNVDDTCISDLAGFNIYYNTTSGDYSTFDDIGNTVCTDSGIDAGTGCGNTYNCSYTKTNIGEGTWYFYITSYDTAGNESDYSNEGSKTITIPKLNSATYVDATHVDIEFSESVTGADDASNYSADNSLQIISVTDQGGNVFRLTTSQQTYDTIYTITAGSNIENSDTNGIDPASNTAAFTVPSDTDGDSIPDSWEMNNFSNLDTASGSTDNDGDGLLDKDEYTANTDPNNSDTDGDGMPDGWEVDNSLDPVTDDSADDLDGDGFSNFIEYISSTNPNDDTVNPDPDFGDAEDPLYPSKDASIGAKHLAFVYEWLGSNIDGESDSKQIDSDQFDDGIEFIPPFEVGVEANIKITVTVSNSSDTDRYNLDDPTKRLYLNSWFDWNGDGDWDDEGEKVIGTGSGITYPNQADDTFAIDPADFGGSNSVDYTLGVTSPVDWVPGGYARFRLDYGEDVGNKQSISGNLTGYLGTAQYGEVEDYIITELTIPKLNTATYVDSTHVDIEFSESVTGADDASNYSADKSLQILSVTDQGGNVFRLTTSQQTYDTIYTITASSNIENSDANGTDPANNTAAFTVPSDTDGDSIPDSWEMDNFSNLVTASGSTDNDSDGLLDKDEYTSNTDPNNSDTDGDGIPDGWEVDNSLDPVTDNSTDDLDGDGLLDKDEYTANTDPNNSDTDGDGMPDGWEVDNSLDPVIDDSTDDNDGDGLLAKDEYTANTDPNNSDTDSDGMPDGWEVDNSLDPVTDDSTGDLDGDGISNIEELISNTGPNDDSSSPDPDFGDAEDPLYPSEDASIGGKHLVYIYEWLGNNVDGESDSKQIDSDQFDDGIEFITPLEAGVTSNMTITVTVLNSSDTDRYNPDDPTKRLYLNSWFDWNNDGDWDDEGEKIIGTGSDITYTDHVDNTFAIDPVNFGSSNSVDYTLGITPPVDWVPGGYARFRLDYGEDAGNEQSLSGNLSGYLGAAQYGEVEDYIITGDPDGDGVPDSEDNNPDNASIATPASSTGSGNITIDTSLNEGASLAEVKALSDTDPSLNQTGKPSDYEFKDGLISFTVNGLDPGETIEITIDFPNELSENAKYFKVNDSGFYEFSGASISGKTVTLTLTDGGSGDNDGEANGVIKDPGGVAEPINTGKSVNDSSVTATGSGTASGSGGGGCAINPKAEFDPVFPLLIISALIYWVGRRRNIKE